MKKITCTLGSRSYPIYVGHNIFSRIPHILKSVGVKKNVCVVTNRRVYSLYFTRLKKELRKAGCSVIHHIVPDNEKAKSQRELFRMYNTLLKHGFDRHSAIVALGGGVVGDVSGFCASTYMRGIDFINIPTTLLAQVDSAIGGKTGINLEKGKNLVGSFYQPRCVICDVALLASLSKKQRADSLAEVIKYGIIWDKKFFASLETSLEKALTGNKTVLERIVSTSVAIKAKVVERDERETTGLRAILNFGHTFGHGIEAATQYSSISHGVAVAYGMLAAARLAVNLNTISQQTCDRIECLIKQLKSIQSLKKYSCSAKQVMHYMQFDKKNKNKKITLVIPARIGRVVVLNDIPNRLILNAINSLFV